MAWETLNDHVKRDDYDQDIMGIQWESSRDARMANEWKERADKERASKEKKDDAEESIRKAAEEAQHLAAVQAFGDHAERKRSKAKAERHEDKLERRERKRETKAAQRQAKEAERQAKGAAAELRLGELARVAEMKRKAAETRKEAICADAERTAAIMVRKDAQAKEKARVAAEEAEVKRKCIESQATQIFRFMEFPLEIKRMIFELAMVKKGYNPATESRPSKKPALLRSSRMNPDPRPAAYDLLGLR